MKLRNLVAITLAVIVTGGCASTENNDMEEAAYLTFQSAAQRQIKVQIHSEESIVSGGGVWLGNGEVLTAFHLFYQPPRILKESDKVTVVFRGHSVPARVVFHGDLEDYDLALVKIEREQTPPELAALDVPHVCNDVEQIGAPLYITAFDSVYSTSASPDGMLMHKGKTWSMSTTAIFSHGVSGSPVFDRRTSCLAGIVSRMKFSPHGNGADANQVACERATLQMSDLGSGVTCAITPQTIFSAADAIKEFIKQAHEYEKSNEIN